MRENRPYGSEGGAAELNRPSLPLSICSTYSNAGPFARIVCMLEDDSGQSFLERC